MDELTLIGRGTYSDVYLYDDIYVIKQFKYNNLKHIAYREIEVLKKCNHPNITKYFAHEIIDDILYIKLEYNGKSLYDTIASYDYLSEVKQIFKQIVDAVYYLHTSEIAHLDLSLRNILINENKVIKLIDFGSATYFNEKVTENHY